MNFTNEELEFIRAALLLAENRAAQQYVKAVQNGGGRAEEWCGKALERYSKLLEKVEAIKEKRKGVNHGQR